MSDDNVTKWMLPEPAPGPQKFRDAKPKKGDVAPSDTHTGTDPLGRAIGPAEDHHKIKKVRDADGKIVTPKAEKKAAERPDLAPPPLT